VQTRWVVRHRHPLAAGRLVKADTNDRKRDLFRPAESLLSRLVGPNRKRRSSPFDMRDVRRYFPEFDDAFPGYLALLSHEPPNDA
jgi:hypothetical protein